jgi:hypothetical protein
MEQFVKARFAQGWSESRLADEIPSSATEGGCAERDAGYVC